MGRTKSNKASLNSAQRHMWRTLQNFGPFGFSDMESFGRKWKEVWRSLEKKGFVTFNEFAKSKHYYAHK